LAYDDLTRLGAVMKKAKPFITAKGWRAPMLDQDGLRSRFVAHEQLPLL